MNRGRRNGNDLRRFRLDTVPFLIEGRGGRHLRLAGPGSGPAGPASLGSHPAREAPLGSGAPAEAAGDAPLGSEGSKPARQAPAGSGEERSGVQAAGGGGGISVRPTAPGDPAQLAAEGDTAVVGSDRSATGASSDTGGPLGTVCLSERGNGPAEQAGSRGSGRQGGQASRCEPYRPVILGKLRQGLSAQRIYQDLVTEAGFAGS